MGVHDGHRDRLRQSFEEHGLESFNEINALELMLFYAVPRKDTNPLAHRLIERFGSLNEVLFASIQELTEVPGISYNAAVMISMVPQLMKKAEMSKTKDMRQILSTKDAGAFLIPRYVNERDEIMLMLCLDNKKGIICCKEMSRGSVNSVEVNVRRIVETALKVKASSVIISHNHPGGLAIPSHEDSSLTKEILRALRAVGIRLEDHIIVSDRDYVSFLDSGMMQMIRM